MNRIIITIAFVLALGVFAPSFADATSVVYPNNINRTSPNTVTPGTYNPYIYNYTYPYNYNYNYNNAYGYTTYPQQYQYVYYTYPQYQTYTYPSAYQQVVYYTYPTYQQTSNSGCVYGYPYYISNGRNPFQAEMNASTNQFLCNVTLATYGY